MAGSLQGRRILLTGISRGVGRATAELFLREGAEILGVAKDPGRLAQAEAELRKLGKIECCAIDLGHPDAGSRLRNEVVRLWGAFDLLINNAGIMVSHTPEITAEPEGKLEESLETNLLAPFRLSRALLPLLRKGNSPRLVHVSSGAGTFDGMTEPGIASYRLSKWALNGLTMLQAKEFAGKVSVLAFDPGWVRTDLGGPNAPGVPEDSAQGLLKTVLLPFSETGYLVKDGERIAW
jgi:NAD(P)-dependent dehydrogenase (short-subunit alcohol dehydrogenase family)